MLDQYGDDNEWDINGQMEKELLEMNEKMFALTGGKQKYKFDYRKDGKLDITFVRIDKKYKELHKWANNDIIPFLNKKKGMNNPKKIYFNYADINNVDGGEAGVGYGTLYLRNKSVPTDERKLLITLHELHHTQGGGYNCVPGMASNGHYANQEPRVQLNSGRKLGATYAHKFENCPQLMDTVYLTPTSSEPYDPYEVNCLFKIGKYNHPKITKIIEQMKKKFEEWTPAIFTGFNSISFDEDVLRQGLFQSFNFPYLTSAKGNRKLDILKLDSIRLLL